MTVALLIGCAVLLIVALCFLPGFFEELEVRSATATIGRRMRRLAHALDQYRKGPGYRPFDIPDALRLLKSMDDLSFEHGVPYWNDGINPSAENLRSLGQAVHDLERRFDRGSPREIEIVFRRRCIAGFVQLESMTGPTDRKGRRKMEWWTQIAEVHNGVALPVEPGAPKINPNMLPWWLKLRAGEQFVQLEIDGVGYGCLPLTVEERAERFVPPPVLRPLPPSPTPPSPPRTPTPPKLTVVAPREPKLSRAERKRRNRGGSGGRNAAIAA